MAKASATSSPLAAAFDFDSAAYIELEEKAESSIGVQIQMIRAALSPSVTQADIAARIVADTFPADTISDEKRASMLTYHRMSVGHFAQAASLAASHPDCGPIILANPFMLHALFKLRTTGTVESRIAMVAKWDGIEDFFDYTAAWGKATRAAKTAAIKAAPKDAPKPKADKAAPADSSIAAIPAPLSVKEAVTALAAAIRSAGADMTPDQRAKLAESLTRMAAALTPELQAA